MFDQLLGMLLQQTGITPEQIQDLYQRLVTAMDTLEEVDARTLEIKEALMDAKIIKV